MEEIVKLIIAISIAGVIMYVVSFLIIIFNFHDINNDIMKSYKKLNKRISELNDKLNQQD